MSRIDPSISALLAAQQDAVYTQVSYAVAAKQLDAQEQQGDAAVKLLQSAVQLSKEPGKGGGIDAQA